MTDFNDMEILSGSDVVKAYIDNCISESNKTDVTHVTDVTAIEVKASDGNLSCTGNVTDVPIVSVPIEDMPCFQVFDKETFVKEVRKILRSGVWQFTIKYTQDKDTDNQPSIELEWICSPIHIKAITCDEKENNFGRQLYFRNSLNSWRIWAMPMALLSGHGESLRAELLSMGVHIDPKGHRTLGSYLQTVVPNIRILCTSQVGWHGKNFVLPDKVIGPTPENIIFQSEEVIHAEYTQAGSFERWQSDLSVLARDNPLLTLALSVSFSGPLLVKLSSEGGGLHFVGNSSTGKTTLIQASCSVWGGSTFRRTWRATANGLEAVAAMFNDSLLALDEINQCNHKEVGEITYMLTNGRGKQRSKRSGAGKEIKHWQCSVISSGETTLETILQQGGEKIKAGQEVRLLNIFVARPYGAWDELHEMPTGAAFSDSIKRTAETHYGHAGILFLEKLSQDGRDFPQMLEKIRSSPAFSLPNLGGQEKRAATRFAIFSAAGELATEYGITGWPAGLATSAAAKAFQLWRNGRGDGDSEQYKISQQVLDFIEKNADSRFSNIDEVIPLSVCHNRAGYWRDQDGARLYLFTAGGMREALKGFDFNRSLLVLQEIGALPVEADQKGAKAKVERVGKCSVRLYSISHEALNL